MFASYLDVSTLVNAIPSPPGEKVRMRVFPPSAKNAEMGMRELGVMSLPALQ
jgi:hypothetical protein